jgi:outer membrane receptor for ferrienterochelin and colicins
MNSNQEIALSELKGYHLADLSINKKLGKMFMLNAGLRNVFDVKRINSTAVSTGVHSEGGSRSIASGRAVFAGITFNWNKK